MVRVATTPDGEEGRIVTTGAGMIIAILVLIDPTQADDLGGSWFLEAGFGPCQTAVPPIFAGLSEARAWIVRQMIGPVVPDAR